MMVFDAINAIFGSTLLLILMFADYARKYNTDSFQRSVFLAVLGFTFAAIVTDFLYSLFKGIPGREARILLCLDISLYYFCQVTAYYLVFIFVDYFTFKNNGRTQKLLAAALALQVVHGGLLAANGMSGFYFFLSPDNIFNYGHLYAIRLVLSYLPSVLAIAEIIFALKHFRQSHAGMILFFFILTCTGSVLDIMLKSSSLVWPCFSMGLLYVYFFIIKTDSKLDSLTGIGNRYSFNEFIDKLARMNAKQSYSIVMIDVDRFKEINDTLGHAEGDNALRDLAAIIKDNIRSSDFAARYGGDEFVLATRAENDIQQTLDRIQKAIDRQNEKNIRPYKIRISHGYDTFTSGSGQSIETFFAHIDSLMYKHKEERRRHTDTYP
jgi:diguanylate cyclase (GGDEF)-like protein